MKGKRRTINLSDEEEKQLIQLSNRLTAPYRLVMRARLILLSAKGIAHKTLAEKFDVQPRVITHWVKRWSETSNGDKIDVESRLADLVRSGAPGKFTAEQKCEIIAIACEKPELYNRPITHWSQRELADEVIKQGIVEKISSSRVGDILKENDIQPHKIRYWLNGKPDEKKTKKSRTFAISI